MASQVHPLAPSHEGAFFIWLLIVCKSISGARSVGGHKAISKGGGHPEWAEQGSANETRSPTPGIKRGRACHMSTDIHMTLLYGWLCL